MMEDIAQVAKVNWIMAIKLSTIPYIPSACTNFVPYYNK